MTTDFYTLFEQPQDDVGLSHQVPQYRYQEQVNRFATEIDRDSVIEEYQDYIEGLYKEHTCVTCGERYKPVVNFYLRKREICPLETNPLQTP